MSEITLEKIDILRSRAGISYREARDILTQANGDIVQALIELENTQKNHWTEDLSAKSGEVMEKIRSIIREGNVRKIRVKHNGRVLVDIPVTIGTIGAVLAPQLAAIGVLAAVYKRCTIEVVRKEEKTGEELVDAFSPIDPGRSEI